MATQILQRQTLLLFVITIVLCSNTLVFAQESENSTDEVEEEKEEEEEKFAISFNPSLTYVAKGAEVDNLNEEGHFVPGIGLDFIYTLNKNWEIIAVIDWELESYVIPRENELKREKALILAALFAHKIGDRFSIVAGGGIELEKNENLGVVRLAAEYKIPLNNKWFIPLAAVLDIKEGYDSRTLSLGIGRGF